MAKTFERVSVDEIPAILNKNKLAIDISDVQRAAAQTGLVLNGVQAVGKRLLEQTLVLAQRTPRTDEQIQARLDAARISFTATHYTTEAEAAGLSPDQYRSPDFVQEFVATSKEYPDRPLDISLDAKRLRKDAHSRIPAHNGHAEKNA